MNNTIEATEVIKGLEDFVSQIPEELKVEGKHYLKYFLHAIDTLKVLESAADELPDYGIGGKADEDIPDNKEDAYPLAYNDGQVDYKQQAIPILAKQILKNKELEKLYKDLANCISPESYSPEHLKFLARRLVKKNKELTEDEITNIIKDGFYPKVIRKDNIMYVAQKDCYKEVAKTIIKAREEK